MKNSVYDVIIIGGGPGGLTAGIYTSREMLDTLLLEKGLCGGLPASTDLIENYPGFPQGSNGMALVNEFKEQAERFGVKINEFEEVKRVEKEDKVVKLESSKGEYTCWTLIVASGSIPKKLGIPGEKEFLGKGVSYCATCDGPLYRDKEVAVIGCGNSGLQEGEALLKYVKKITFIEFLPYMTGDKILQERLKHNEKAEFFLNHQLVSINGEDMVDSINVIKRATKEEKKINVAGVFIYAGFLPNTKFLSGLVELDGMGYIKTDVDMQTSLSGIFAAGDVRSKKFRQITMACGEGTVAALSVRDYLQNLKGSNYGK